MWMIQCHPHTLSHTSRCIVHSISTFSSATGDDKCGATNHCTDLHQYVIPPQTRLAKPVNEVQYTILCQIRNRKYRSYWIYIYKPAVSLSAAQRPKPIAWLDIENRVDTHSAIDRWVFLGQHLLYGSLIYDFGSLASADCVYGLLHYLYYRKIITSLGRGPSALRLGQGRCQVAQYLIGGSSNNKSLSYARLDVWHKLLTACWYWFNSIYTANMSIAFQVIF